VTDTSTETTPSETTSSETGNLATFTTMQAGTKQDWDIIGGAMVNHAVGVVDRVVNHLELLRGDHGGFAIDRLEHSLQTATRAYRDNRDTEYVVCALIHDIGDTLGPYNHPDIAAAILKPFVSDENLWMVQHHGIFQGYYFFGYLGLDPDMREQYRGQPNFDRTEEFCAEYDQNSFDPTYRSMSLADFEPALHEVMSTVRHSIYKKS
jgi:predicted HD phosphohydrolase